MNKDKRFEIRLSQIQFESLNSQAKEKGMSASELVRFWIEAPPRRRNTTKKQEK